MSEFKQIIVDGERIAVRLPEPEAIARIALTAVLVEWLEKAAPKDERPMIDEEARQLIISRASVHHWHAAKFQAALAANPQLQDDRQMKKLVELVVADAKERGQG